MVIFILLEQGKPGAPFLETKASESRTSEGAGLLAVPGRLVGVPHHWQGLGPERRGLHHGGGPLPRAPQLSRQQSQASGRRQAE